MNSSKKDANLIEKFKQALASTEKVISGNFKFNNEIDQNKHSNKLNKFELENLNNRNDFIKARAESDSNALKIRFSNDKIYKKNLPNNSSCKALYLVAEKIRYESLGIKMLKGVEKNLKENYNHLVNRKKKDQPKSKEDVPVIEAFELYMLKNFHNIKLNQISNEMLNFWEKDFEEAIDKHKDFLIKNLESQNKYSSKFSEILQEMEIFQTDENEESKEENQDDGQNNSSNQDEEKNSEDKKDQNKDEETQASLESEYDIDEYKLDEQLIDTESENQNNEQIIQKKKY